ncbi:unnamed protein product [Moneuplotes crassus]|uniref:Major facilitator superfamily (MFS) profile domain-containing protein n=1 Tax=Euplotes crassus TaxID=5936 RepID=A0AAD1X8L7_EUPCR|nr:unnamed protein product [Moneuplotes crassus]
MTTISSTQSTKDLEAAQKEKTAPLITKEDEQEGNESFSTDVSYDHDVSLLPMVYLCVVNMLLNCSYGICAPLLPIDAERHDIDQIYLGFMFCVYSVSMAIFSPIVGKYLYTLGRRNMCKWGMIIVAAPFLGFFLSTYLTNSVLYIAVFMTMRVIQGFGTSMVQTSSYSILTLTYPTKINFVIACIETSAGLGLSLGPVIGTILYELGGSALPFLTFFVISITIGLVIKRLIPCFVDDIQSNSVQTDEEKPKYSELLTTKRVVFACLCVFIAVFQFAFIDPILAEYMKETFNIQPQTSGYFFLALGLGYMISCIVSPFYLRYFSNMRVSMISCFILGIITIFYSSSYILWFLTPNMVVLTVALLLAGIANSHLMITPMEEMIEAAKGRTDSASEVLNDMCSGLFNMFFALGEIFGPMIGNLVFSLWSFAGMCDVLGVGCVIFAVVYFLSCDLSLHKAPSYHHLSLTLNPKTAPIPQSVQSTY